VSSADPLRVIAFESRRAAEIATLIERTELVRRWLESAARCECPDLDQCPLFDDPPLAPAPRQPPRSPFPI